MIISYARNVGIAVVIAVLVASFAATAHAHKVNVFAYAEGGKVHTESYFADGTRAAGCRVTVEDMSGRQLLEGTTDKDGMFSFDIPGPEDLRIVLHASMGHQNDYVIKASELTAALPGGGGEAKTWGAESRPVKEKPAMKEKPSARVSGTAAAAAVSVEELRAVVDETVESRLKPLYAMLADMREAEDKPDVSEVVGGIGYIMGIMGVILYFKSRKV